MTKPTRIDPPTNPPAADVAQAVAEADVGPRTTAADAERRATTATLLPAADVDLAALRERLVGSADDQALLDVAYRVVDSPLGALLLAATERGLARVAFQSEGFENVLESVAAKISPRILRAPRRLESATRQLDEYFEGRRHDFDIPLDHVLSTGFRGRVHRSLSGIAYGTTRSYGQVAAELGSPRAVRAVGTACATNPLPVVVPCHRVVRGDGSLGGYLGGLDAKRTLLGVEAAA